MKGSESEQVLLDALYWIRDCGTRFLNVFGEQIEHRTHEAEVASLAIEKFKESRVKTEAGDGHGC